MRRRTLKVLLTILALVALPVVCGLALSTHPSHAQPSAAHQSDSVSTTCPKCKGTMVPGFVRDYFDSNSFDPAVWSPEGEKQHAFSLGNRIKITVYRCTTCGYLESYAK